jgi:hypothetical protein
LDQASEFLQQFFSGDGDGGSLAIDPDSGIGALTEEEATPEMRGASAYNKGAASASSFNTAKNHWDKHFVPRMKAAPQDTPANKAWLQVGKADTFMNTDPAKVTFFVLDQYAETCMHTLPKYESAARYLSAIKNKVQDLMVQRNPSLGDYTINTKKISAGMLKFYGEKAQKEGKDMKDGHYALKDEDILAINTLCILFQDK